MNICKTLILAGLCAGSFLSTTSTATAQVQVMNAPKDEDRRGSNVIMFGDAGISAFVAVTFSAPKWDDKYDKEGALDMFKGKGVRLGKNWWTTLDTTCALEIAGKKLEAGSYVLGLHVTEKGDMHLVAINSTDATKHKMMPWDGKSWKKTTHIPLKLEKGKLEKTHQKMDISIRGDEKNVGKGEFAIRWGTHELSAPVKFHLEAMAKNAGYDKKK